MGTKNHMGNHESAGSYAIFKVKCMKRTKESLTLCRRMLQRSLDFPVCDVGPDLLLTVMELMKTKKQKTKKAPKNIAL